MSLSSLLSKDIKGNSGIDWSNEKWRQFILDHLDYIAVRCTTYSIDAPQMNLFRYDLKRFLKVRMNRHEDLTWVVQLLNSIKIDFEFDEPRDLLIPSDTDIINLYHSFISIIANAR